MSTHSVIEARRLHSARQACSTIIFLRTSIRNPICDHLSCFGKLTLEALAKVLTVVFNPIDLPPVACWPLSTMRLIANNLTGISGHNRGIRLQGVPDLPRELAGKGIPRSLKARIADSCISPCGFQGSRNSKIIQQRRGSTGRTAQARGHGSAHSKNSTPLLF